MINFRFKMKYLNHFAMVALVLASFYVAPASAQDEQELAKKSQNPVAAMISLPMKNNFNFGRGDENAFAYGLELQPVYPVSLGKFNLINRFIIPITYQEPAYEGMDYEFGLRDTTYQAFFSPADAVTLCERAFRAGGVARDAVYLTSWLRVRRAVDQGEANLGELQLGKVSLSALPELRRLAREGRVTQPVYLSNLARSLGKTGPGTRSATFPPSLATSLTRLDAT